MHHSPKPWKAKYHVTFLFFEKVGRQKKKKQEKYFRVLSIDT